MCEWEQDEIYIVFHKSLYFSVFSVFSVRSVLRIKNRMNKVVKSITLFILPPVKHAAPRSAFPCVMIRP